MSAVDTLTPADFAPMNELLANVRINLPTISERFTIPTVNLPVDFVLSDLVCYDLQLSKLEVSTSGDAGFDPVIVDPGVGQMSPDPPAPPPPPPRPPRPAPCTPAPECTAGCGQREDSDYHDDTGMPSPASDKCIFCDSYYISNAPSWCEYRYDG